MGNAPCLPSSEGEGKESEGGGGPLPGLSLAQLWRIVLGPTSWTAEAERGGGRALQIRVHFLTSLRDNSARAGTAAEAGWKECVIKPY